MIGWIATAVGILAGAVIIRKIREKNSEESTESMISKLRSSLSDCCKKLKSGYGV